MAVELQTTVDWDSTDTRQWIDGDSAGILMTPDEFEAIEEWDEQYRYELVHGVLVVSPIPSILEADVNEELGRLLRNYSADHPNGSCLDLTVQERYIRFGDSIRRPDRAVWIGLGRYPDEKIDRPALLIEFVSQGTRNWKRDYIVKRDLYLAAGVKEYWVIDRFSRMFTVFRNAPAQPAERKFVEAEVYRPELLPGFEISVATLFARFEALLKKASESED